MIRVVKCVLALVVVGSLALTEAGAQDPPFRGSQETTPPAKSQSSGFTLDKLHGMPMIRPSLPTYQMYQPYYYGGYYSYGYPQSYSLGGYYPQRSLGSGGLNVWVWAR